MCPVASLGWVPRGVGVHCWLKARIGQGCWLLALAISVEGKVWSKGRRSDLSEGDCCWPTSVNSAHSSDVQYNPMRRHVIISILIRMRQHELYIKQWCINSTEYTPYIQVYMESFEHHFTNWTVHCTVYIKLWFTESTEYTPNIKYMWIQLDKLNCTPNCGILSLRNILLTFKYTWSCEPNLTN